MSKAKKAGFPAWRPSSSSKLVPVAPESSESPVAKKRKRLAKVFSRPLDKKIKELGRSRAGRTMREFDRRQLHELRLRLADQGFGVRKSKLLRAGLQLLAELGDDDFQQMLAKRHLVGRAIGQESVGLNGSKRKRSFGGAKTKFQRS